MGVGLGVREWGEEGSGGVREEGSGLWVNEGFDGGYEFFGRMDGLLNFITPQPLPVWHGDKIGEPLVQSQVWRRAWQR